MNIALLTNLLIGHLLADFPLQMYAWVKDKQERIFCGYGMWIHLIVVFMCEWAALGKICLLDIALLITMSHILIDYLKVRFTSNGPIAFAVDQVAHIAILCCIAKYLPMISEWHQLSIVPQEGEVFYPFLACGYLFCISPANFIIREILKYCHVQKSDNENDEKLTNNIKLSGMLIGSLERCLVLTFILIGSFEAAGLTVAAKSLLRFKDDERLRTEYVLIGTLLSILIAVICALAIFKFGMNATIIKMPK